MLTAVNEVSPGCFVVPMNTVSDTMFLMPSEPVVHVEDVVIVLGHQLRRELVSLQDIETQIHLVLDGDLGHQKPTVDFLGIRAFMNIYRLVVRDICKSRDRIESEPDS